MVDPQPHETSETAFCFLNAYEYEMHRYNYKVMMVYADAYVQKGVRPVVKEKLE